MSNVDEASDDESVGYRKPPRSTRFEKGKSGNPRGRPRNRRREIPYEHVLGQMVTIRHDGRDQRVTAAEAFLLSLTKKGLEGDSASARSSLAAIEAARARRPVDGNLLTIRRIILMSYGVGSTIQELGMAIKLNRLDEKKVRFELKPWIVEAAFARLGDRRLTTGEQKEVWDASRTPEEIDWPEWWTYRGVNVR